MSSIRPVRPLLAALSPRRQEILGLIWDEARSVSDLAEAFGISLPAVSQHLAKLKAAGLVTVRKDGRRRLYRADTEGMEEAELLGRLVGGRPASRPPTPPSVVGIPRVRLAAEGRTVHTPGSGTIVTGAAPPGLDRPGGEEISSAYRQGLLARLAALRTYRDAAAEGEPDALDAVRRVAATLTRPALADCFAEIARAAGDLFGAEPSEILVGLDRLIGALAQESVVDDRIARILIVENSRTEALLLESMVGGPNREVLMTSSAEEAQGVLEGTDVDLIVLDLGLPGEDGRAFLGRLTGRARTRAVPVIVMTSRTDPATRTEVLSLGADGFYAKPPERSVLTAAVAMLLERSAEIQRLGREDLLTGLSNRSVFLQRARQMASSSIRSGASLSLAILEVDRLQVINEVHGALAGDEALRAVGHAIARSFRRSDAVARWAGDKFAILLAGAPASGGERALANLEEATRELSVTFGGVALTPSWRAGIAEIDQHHDLDGAIGVATRRLHHATESQRIVASDEALAEQPDRVLLVEDDEILADLLEHRLEREGIEVVRFGDGAEAMSALADLTVSAVILDTMLPGVDGFEILAALRDAPSLAGIPVVMLTFGGNHDTRRALELGADDALEKPFSATELIARVCRLLGRPQGGRGAPEPSPTEAPRAPAG